MLIQNIQLNLQDMHSIIKWNKETDKISNDFDKILSDI